MNRFTVTFETYTDESVEQGEAADMGVVDSNLSLRDALALVGHYVDQSDSAPISRNNPPRWFTNNDYRARRNGDDEDESRAIHLPRNITPSSAIRVARVLLLNHYA